MFRKSVVCLGVFTLGLLQSGCAMPLKQASHAWNEPGQVQLAHNKGKNWGPDVVSGAEKSSVQPASQPAKPSVNPGKKQPQETLQPPELGDLPRVSHPVVETARQFLGTPYKWAGETPAEGFDCSGLIHYVFGQHGVAMQRTADKQFLQGAEVRRTALQAGDLVFFNTYGQGASHVGIYTGNDLFIHAPRTGRNVSYDSLSSAYYSARYLGARRIF